MEEGAEKMAALKRAYADIILNTAKESAVRVLAAERRALGFQQSLFTSKEEALATMIRLKALMEDKIREAEKTTLCQAKKIEELELQLGEAEDTIVDLREELKRVREELTLMKSGSFQLFNEGIRNDTCIVCNNVVKEKSTDNLDELGNRSTFGNFRTISSPKTGDTHQCLKNVEKAEHRKEFSLKDDCAGTTDLASIIWSSKVPELYRKGHTQRIHALEHDSTTKVSLSESNGLQISSKSELLTCSSDKHQIACKADSARSDKRTVLVKDTSIFANTEQQPGYHKPLETKHEAGCFTKDHFTLSNRSLPREHRLIYSHSNVSSYSIFSNKSKSCSSCSEVTVHDKQNEIEALKETPVPFAHEAMEISDTAEDKMALADISTEREALKFNQCIDTYIKKESMEIKQCTKKINWQSVQKQNQFVCESKSLQTSFQNGEDVIDPLLIKAFPKTGGPTFSLTIHKVLKNQQEDAVASKPVVGNAPESSVKCNVVNPDTKDTENGNAHAGTDKFLKYTFQRKRKKGSSPIENEIMFPEKRSTLKSNSADKQNSLSAPSKSSVVTDLPRNNRRLVQVARQLISLSEKRW